MKYIAFINQFNEDACRMFNLYFIDNLNQTTHGESKALTTDILWCCNKITMKLQTINLQVRKYQIHCRWHFPK